MVTCAFFVKNHVKLNKKHIFVKKCKKTQKMWFFMISCIFNPFCRFAVFYSWILCLACKSYYLLQLYISCANQWNPVKCIENVCAKRMHYPKCQQTCNFRLVKRADVHSNRIQPDKKNHRSTRPWIGRPGALVFKYWSQIGF